ncbi:hypothetical protein LMCDFJHI_00896 [Aeromonas salmonicida]
MCDQHLLAAQCHGAKQRVGAGAGADPGAAGGGILAGADKDRNVLAHRRLQGGRVQHLGAKGSHLSRFHEAYFRNGACACHQSRIRGVDAGHIGPDLYAARIQRFGEQGGAVIGAAATKRGGAAIGIRADEALSDDEAVAEQGPQRLLAEAASGTEIHGRLAKAAVGAHQLAHILPVGLDTTLVQQLGEEAGRHQLATGDEPVSQLCIRMLTGLAGHGADLAEGGMDQGTHVGGIAQCRQYGLLDLGQFGQLCLLACLVQIALGQCHQQIGDAGAGAQYHHPGCRIGQYHIGAVVHGRGIGDTGSAKLGDIHRAHCLLLS